MDPAGRNFIEVDNKLRLDRSDADFVQVIHTNVGPPISLGNWQRLGHVDVYLNGGARQPGCIALSNGLNHDRAFRDELKSINKTKVYQSRPRQLINSYTYAVLSSNRLLQVQPTLKINHKLTHL
jgi:hypothetical protein